jgi:hypothetical protein
VTRFLIFTGRDDSINRHKVLKVPRRLNVALARLRGRSNRWKSADDSTLVFRLAPQCEHLAPEAAVLIRVLDTAWDEVAFALARSDLDSTRLRTLMALAIAAAIREGERDLDRLKEIGLETIAAAY